jgi:hypothetical protein
MFAPFVSSPHRALRLKRLFQGNALLGPTPAYKR